MAKRTRIVITGIGPISSTGIGKNAFWDGLRNPKPKIRMINCNLGRNRWVNFKKFMIKDFNLSSFRIDEQKLRGIYDWKEGEEDIDLAYLLASVKLAIEDSRLSYDKEDNTIGLIVMHENPGLEQYFSSILDNAFSYFLKRSKQVSKVRFYDFMFNKMLKQSFELQTFMPLFHIANTFDLHGYSLYLNNACASGAYGLEEAKRIIQSNRSKVVILVACDIPNVYKYLWFKKLGMYSSSGIMRPFSSKADGFLMGDGATALIVENFESAKARSADIYAEYLGGGFCSESWKVTVSNPLQGYYEKAIRDALKEAKIASEDLDILVPHGVATKFSDRFEVKVLEKVFNVRQNRKLTTLALKSYFGHNLGGNVLLELAALLMMMKKQTILANLNIENEESITRLNLNTATTNRSIQLAIKTTCAFAGFDSAIILKRI